MAGIPGGPMGPLYPVRPVLPITPGYPWEDGREDHLYDVQNRPGFTVFTGVNIGVMSWVEHILCLLEVLMALLVQVDPVVPEERGT